MGTDSCDSVDYPDYAQKAAEAVARGEFDQGLLVCGSGTGMAIAANKIHGVRAAVAWNEDIARLAREHNDANVLSLAARFNSPEEMDRIVRAWFAADFEGGRHAKRVEKIKEIDK
jgi:ribose 5-phosphate isomerase B